MIRKPYFNFFKSCTSFCLLFIIFAIIFFALSTQNVSADSYGDFNYSVSGSSIIINGYDGLGGDVEIPSTIEGVTVTAIGNSTFYNNVSLSGIIIPNSITSIGNQAFWYCPSLETINVDSTNLCYRSINGVLFDYNATELIKYPDGNSNTSYIIPSSVTRIGDYAFSYCSNLQHIDTPDSVINIGSGAFAQCTSLNNMNLPSNITIIEPNTFFGCASLAGITIPNRVTRIGDSAFAYCWTLSNIDLPNSLTSIGDGAFNSCEALTSISIPSGVGSIGESAFNNCHELDTIENLYEGNQTIGEFAFNTRATGALTATSYTCNTNFIDATTLAGYSVSFVDNTNGDYDYTIINKEATIEAYTGLGGDVEIPSTLGGVSVTAISSWAFDNNSSVTSITIPGSVTNLSISNIFWHCNNLKTINVDPNNSYFSSIEGVLFNKSATEIIAYPPGNLQNSYTIPNGVSNIKYGAFGSCSRLNSIIIPNTVTNIEGQAFFNCLGLVDIILPSSVTSMGAGVFSACNSLTNINVNASSLYYSSIEGVLFNKTATKLISYANGKLQTAYTIPSSVTKIDDGAFDSCNNINNIIIPNSVESIGQFAFLKCINLTEIIIPNSVKSIETNAFNYCTSLASITIPDSVTSLGESAFLNCINLRDVTIQKGLNIIEGNTFYNCSNLINITIPNSVTSIKELAFTNCSSLTTISIPDSVENIDAEAFSDCPNLRQVIIPSTTISIAEDAFINSPITVYGVDSSYAETFAQENAISFIPLTSLNITTSPTKTLYTAGQTFNASGMIVEAVYSDGVTTGAIGYTYEPSGTLTIGVNKIVINYEGMIIEQLITVTSSNNIGGGGNGGTGSGGGILPTPEIIPVTTEPAITSKMILRFNIGVATAFMTTGEVIDGAKSMDAAPMLFMNRTLLPIRFVVEALNGSITWNPNEKKVMIVRGETTIELWIGNNTAKVNGIPIMIDPDNPKLTPIIVSPGRAMLPVRFISEILGCTVEWNQLQQQVIVKN